MTATHWIRRALVAPAFIALFAGCNVANDLAGRSISPVAGTYSALVFRVTPTGQAPIDVLSEGGGITIAIDADGKSTGSLSVPASAAGGTALTAAMTGTAIVDGSTMHFQQDADTFIRNLKWTVGTLQLSVSNQVVGGASYTITMIRL